MINWLFNKLNKNNCEEIIINFKETHKNIIMKEILDNLGFKKNLNVYKLKKKNYIYKKDLFIN